jgi:hypothetical protein
MVSFQLGEFATLLSIFVMDGTAIMMRGSQEQRWPNTPLNIN